MPSAASKRKKDQGGTDRSKDARRLSASLEDYLEAIYHQAQADGVARVSQIARHLAVNKSSVTGALRNLADRGLVDYDPYQYVKLTDPGRKLAKDVAWRHGVLQRFLTEVLNVEQHKAAQTACKLEHSMDHQVLNKLLRFIQFVHNYSEGGKQWQKLFKSFYQHGQPRHLCAKCAELAALRDDT